MYRGEGPTPFDPSLDAPGAPTYPRRYGYAWVGEVVESRSAEHALGARIFALAPHADEHCLDAAQARLLPAGLPPERAVLAANLETAVNVGWDAGIALGDRVLVVGGGIVGLLAGYVARKSGASRLRLLEPSARRRQAALALGFDEVSSPEAAGSWSADLVIEAQRQPGLLGPGAGTGPRRGRRGRGFVLWAARGARLAGQRFSPPRLTLRSSQVSRLPPSRHVGWSFARRFGLVAELLQNPLLDALIDPAVPLAEAPAIYARLARTPGEALQTVFNYNR